MLRTFIRLNSEVKLTGQLQSNDVIQMHCGKQVTHALKVSMCCFDFDLCFLLSHTFMKSNSNSLV